MLAAVSTVARVYGAAPVVDGFAGTHATVPLAEVVAMPEVRGRFATVVNGEDSGKGVEGYISAEGETRESAGVKVPLLVDGKVVGEVVMGQDSGGSGTMVFWPEVHKALAKVVEADVLAKVDGKVQGQVWPLGVTEGGIGLQYDPAQVAVVANVVPTARRMEDVGVQEPTTAPLGKVVKPAAVSAFVNMYGATSYVQDLGINEGFQPLNLDFDGAVNVRDWVLEGRVNYLQDEVNPLSLQDTRVVRDDPARMLRYQVGQVSYPVTGFQKFTPMLGAGVARNFSLQPYRITQPLGRSEFVLNSPATVDIYVNGARVKTLQLAAGVYALNDFPVVNGANNVKLVITDATGRSEEKTFPVVSDSNLLAQGLSEFALSGGVPMNATGRGLSYDGDRPQVVGLWRYGMDEAWTLGGNFQGDGDTQMAGLEQVRMSKLGLVGSQVAVSRGVEGLGAAGRLEYRWLAPARTEWDAGASYRALRGVRETDYRASAALYYRPLEDVFVTVDGSYGLQDRFGLLLNLAWTPGGKNETWSAGYDTANQATTVRWARHRQSNQVGLDSDLELEKSRDDVSVDGALAYAGERGNVRLEHDQRDLLNSKVRGVRTQLSGATAWVMADGQSAWTAPVANSFAIVTAADGVRDTGVEINPAASGETETYDARSDALGPAVLRDLTAYTPRSIYAEVGQMRGGENTNFVLNPSYKSGLHVVAGMPGQVAVQGVIVDAHEQPLALQAGTLARTDKPKGLADVEPSAGATHAPRLVFTNREGLFRIEGLAPGHYRMQLSDGAQHSVEFAVPQVHPDEIDLGSYKVDMLPGRSMSTKVQ